MDKPEDIESGGACPQRARKYDAAGTRRALLGAALGRFAQYGYDGTSVRDIARDAGVDAALVYRYFGSKQALFEAVSKGSVLFEPLRCLELDGIPEWVCDFVSSGPGEDHVPHPLLTILRSSSREEAVGRLRDHVTAVFSETFAQRLEGPDAQVRAELLAAWVMGISLLRLAVQSPGLSSAPDSALLPYLRAGIEPLLNPVGAEGFGAERPGAEGPGADGPRADGRGEG
ncbi:TetR/AcrR family transcriptional regulator [Streptomyces sp. NRRL F-5135]|uniref:TetR/AcrR family transcriptional regulator n=1 Tax=Streptomyces sp. NRRL F-5135 TaxID=1463858 RepID=UPI0007C437FF|nr:TetR/AcrR family transcriptional regulator [Streptomyces sp. NRRL F-5135]